MEVIGITEPKGYSRQKAYIAIVTHEELCAVMNKSTCRDDDTVHVLKVGETFNLAQGHNYRAEITDAVKKMAEAYEKFAKVAPIAAEFAGIVAAKADAT